MFFHINAPLPALSPSFLGGADAVHAPLGDELGALPRVAGEALDRDDLPLGVEVVDDEPAGVEGVEELARLGGLELDVSGEAAQAVVGADAVAKELLIFTHLQARQLIH